MTRDNSLNKTILYVALSQKHISIFHQHHLRWLRNNGYSVEIASRLTPGFVIKEQDKYHEVAFTRLPFTRQNIIALYSFVKLLRSKEYTFVHCHTPVASVLTRLASLFAKGRPVVLYTSHGFHFFPGAPLSNWLLWFPIEWLFTRLTDFVITINRWDEKAAKRWLRAKRVRLIPGIGIDSGRFHSRSLIDYSAQRIKLDIPQETFVLLYIAEFIPRKNHAFLIKAMQKLHVQIPGSILLLAGDGQLLDSTKADCANRGLSSMVKFLGFRHDISELSLAADLSVSASRQEGLGLGLAELMYIGVPVVASEDRGHRELVKHGVTGFLYPQDDEDEFVKYVVKLYEDPELRKIMGLAALEHAQSFSLDKSVASMANIYQEAEQLVESRKLFRECFAKYSVKRR